MTVARTLERLAAPDYALMRRVNRWQAPRWVRWWMLSATRAGDGWFWAFCGLMLLASSDPNRYTAFGASGLAAATGILLFRYLKVAVGRRRPCHIETHCWADLLPPDQFSFPSGHSISAFAIALPLVMFYPAFGPLLWFCAASVAVSRVVLGMHFLSDVVVGSAMGCGLGYAAYWLLI